MMDCNQHLCCILSLDPEYGHFGHRSGGKYSIAIVTNL